MRETAISTLMMYSWLWSPLNQIALEYDVLDLLNLMRSLKFTRHLIKNSYRETE